MKGREEKNVPDSLKVNIIARPEFELMNYSVAVVHHANCYKWT